MDDNSDKSVIILIVIALLISISGILIVQKGFEGLTGTATATGVTNLTVAQYTSINVSNNIEFGYGYVYTNSSRADMYSNNATVCDDNNLCETVSSGNKGRGGNWTFAIQFITVENNGNKNVTLDINNSVKNASEMIGGTSPRLMYYMQNQEASSCVGGIMNGSSWQNLNWTDSNYTQRVCVNLQTTDASDILNLSIHVRVPGDAPSGVKTTTITFTGTAI